MEPARTPAGDSGFVRAFFDLELPADAFDHEAHVRLAFLLLRDHDHDIAVERFVTGLKAFAGHHGSPGKYHETVTLFSLQVVAGRMASRTARDWPAFAATNRDLIDAYGALLARYYSPDRLASKVARSRFLPPDRQALETRSVAG